MKYTLPFLLMCVVCGVLLFGQDSPPSSSRAESSAETANGQDANKPKPGITPHPLEVLSDTGGINLHSYFSQMAQLIKAAWYLNVPDIARAPVRKRGKVAVGFRVMKDGKIEDVHYVESSGDTSLDQAAYNSITILSGVLPLPKEFACQYIVLRFHFLYNPDKASLIAHPPQENALLPCVTTKIHMVGQIGIEISPTSVQLATNAKQQFSATVTVDASSAVSWIVAGPGCSASTCGTISAEGLYFAPARIPDSATIMVTATIADKPSETASASVKITPESPSR